jgi:hypothetical protein
MGGFAMLETLQFGLQEAHSGKGGVNENSATNKYSFYHIESSYLLLRRKLEKFSEKQLLQVLGVASDRRCDFDSFEKFGTRREFRVTAHILLNERGVAPEFRDAKSGVTHNAKHFPDEAQESNDRQVIDLHWLYLKHRDAIKPKPVIKGLFDAEQFNFDEASSFISAGGRVSTKINNLGIPTRVQKLLLTLRDEEVYKRQKFIRAKTDKVKQILMDRIHEPSSRLPEEVLESMCAAFRCLLMADGSPLDAAVFWQLLPSYLRQQGPKNILPWLKTRKSLLTKLLGNDIWSKPTRKGPVLVEDKAES